MAFGPPVSCGLDLELPPTIYPSPEEARQWSHCWHRSLAKWCLGPVFLLRGSEQYMRGQIQQPLATWAMSVHVTFIKCLKSCFLAELATCPCWGAWVSDALIAGHIRDPGAPHSGAGCAPQVKGTTSALPLHLESQFFSSIATNR